MNASNVNEGGILPTFPLRILVQTSFPSYSQLLGFETTKHSTFIIRKAAPLPSGWSGTKQLKRPYSPGITTHKQRKYFSLFGKSGAVEREESEV
jgi:hypothetical protein